MQVSPNLSLNVQPKLKDSTESLPLMSSQHQSNPHNYTPTNNENVYRAEVQQHANGRHFQNVSSLANQEHQQRYESPAKKRVYFTPEQRNELEELYKNQQYPTRDDKSNLAKSLNIDENKIQVWFQNRRARDRRPRCTRRKLRASHGFSALNFIHNMAHHASYASPSILQTLNQPHHEHHPTALNPYAGRQLTLGYGMNIFASNWQAQQSIQSANANTAHFSTTGQSSRSLLDGWNSTQPFATTANDVYYQQQQLSQNDLNSGAASDNSFDANQKGFNTDQVQHV